MYNLELLSVQWFVFVVKGGLFHENKLYIKTSNVSMIILGKCNNKRLTTMQNDIVYEH